MEERERKAGLLMATPSEEAEAERWLAVGQKAILRQLDERFNTMKQLVDRKDYRGALVAMQEFNKLLLELEFYF